MKDSIKVKRLLEQLGIEYEESEVVEGQEDAPYAYDISLEDHCVSFRFDRNEKFVDIDVMCFVLEKDEEE